MDAPTPMRAAPMPPRPATQDANVYYPESLDDILVSDQAEPRAQVGASVDERDVVSKIKPASSKDALRLRALV